MISTVVPSRAPRPARRGDIATIRKSVRLLGAQPRTWPRRARDDVRVRPVVYPVHGQSVGGCDATVDADEESYHTLSALRPRSATTVVDAEPR